MCSIDWCAFTWEAFATLAAGGAAVVGATIVGLKQASIAGRQADILAQQAEVEQASLRAGLFDRRWKVHKAIQAYIRAAFVLRTEEMEIDFDTTKDFHEAIEDAQFLFDGKVLAEILELGELADNMIDERRELKELRQAGRPDNAKLEHAVSLKRKALRERSSALVDAMGGEMRLFISTPATPPAG